MGNFLGHVYSNEPDVVSGLSDRDIHAVQKTWQIINADPITNGMELFVRLFRAIPETQNFFATIKGLPEETFTDMYQFKAHVLNFMSHLNLAVTNLHQPMIVKSLMEKLGKTHKRFGVTSEHLNVLTEIILDKLRTSLHADEDIISSWSKFMTFIINSMTEVLLH